MKLYKRMVKPIIVSPNQYMEFEDQDVENNDIWYEEELIPELRNKFSKDKRICEPFIYLSFRDKYVEVNMGEFITKDRI